MVRKFLLSAFCITILSLPSTDCWGRGFGGGGGFSGGGGFGGGAGHSPSGFSGGGHGPSGFSGGGFGGGASHSPSGARPGGSGFGGSGFDAGGAGFGAGGFGAGGAGRSPGGSAMPGRGGSGFGAGDAGPGGSGFGAGGAGRGPGGEGGWGSGGIGGQGPDGNRFSSPNGNQLSSFLGLPSDEGVPHGNPARMNNFSGAQGAAFGAAASNRNSFQATGGQGAAAGAAAANRNDPNYSGAQGAAAGVAAANRNSPQYSGAQGAAAGAAVANRNDPRYSGAQGALAGYAAGFNRTWPSARYGTATEVRGNFDHYDLYGSNWNVDHPGAWMAAGWGANNAWRAATWASAGAWCGCVATQPLYYDYGNNVTYENDNVYVNGQDAGTTQQYYGQASALAQSGAAAEAPSDGDWLPLGVFALTKADQKNSIVTIQLAVNKQGVIRGNYTDTTTDKTMVIQGAVDKQTQRVAFTVGDNKTNLIETGLYNLTKDEAPALVHVGNDKTAQYLLVRLDKDAQAASGSPTS